MSRDKSTELPVIDPAGIVERRERSVAGVLLAAGAGSRFEDGNKLLARIDGEPVIHRAARTLADANLDRLVAVLGNDADRVEAALEKFDFEVIQNPAYAEGQSSSVRCGIDAISADGVVIALGDMPSVTPSSVDALVRVYRADKATALAAAYNGKRGNPVLFDRQYFDALQNISGDTGGREILLRGDNTVLVKTDDPGVLCDIDTQQDLAALQTE